MRALSSLSVFCLSTKRGAWVCGWKVVVWACAAEIGLVWWLGLGLGLGFTAWWWLTAWWLETGLGFWWWSRGSRPGGGGAVLDLGFFFLFNSLVLKLWNLTVWLLRN